MEQNEDQLAAAGAEPEPAERPLSSSGTKLLQRTESREDRLAQQQAERAAELRAQMETEVARLAAVQNSHMAAFVQQEEHAKMGTPSPSPAAGWEANHRERAKSTPGSRGEGSSPLVARGEAGGGLRERLHLWAGASRDEPPREAIDVSVQPRGKLIFLLSLLSLSLIFFKLWCAGGVPT